MSDLCVFMLRVHIPEDLYEALFIAFFQELSDDLTQHGLILGGIEVFHEFHRIPRLGGAINEGFEPKAVLEDRVHGVLLGSAVLQNLGND